MKQHKKDKDQRLHDFISEKPHVNKEEIEILNTSPIHRYRPTLC